MKIVISPAKSLDFESELPTNKSTEAKFLLEAERLNKELKKKSSSSLSKLMSISANLGQLNFERNQDWHLPFSPSNARPAVYAFAGDVYTGLDAYTLSEEKIDLLMGVVREVAAECKFQDSPKKEQSEQDQYLNDLIKGKTLIE